MEVQDKTAGTTSQRPHDSAVQLSPQVSALVEQSKNLRVQGVPEQALRLFAQVKLADLTNADARSILIEQGTVKEQIGDASCIEDFQRAVELSTMADPDDIMRVARSLFQHGKIDEALRFIEHHSDTPVLDESPDRLDVLDVMWGTLARFDLERREEAKSRLESGLARLEHGDNLGYLGAGMLAELAFERVATVQAGVNAVDALLVAAEEQLDPDDLQSLAWFWYAYAAHVAGFNMRSIAILNRVIRSARKHGLRTQYVQAIALRSGPLFHLGYLYEAAADAENALAAAQSPQQYIVPSTRGTLTQLRIWTGDDPGAQALVTKQDSLSLSATGADMLYLYGKATAQFHQQQIGQCIASLDRAGELQKLGNGDNPAMIPWASLKAEALIARGCYEEAADWAADELARAQNFGSPGPIGIAMRAKALASEVPDIELLQQSIDFHEIGERKVEHAQALLSLGTALAVDYPDDARPVLREAMGLANKIGASRLEQQAKTQLIASGGRPRRTALEGIAALTPAEHRVLSAACEGLTNREIAEQLFIALKSVEWHLTSSYRKLHVAGREQAREIYRLTATRSLPFDLA